jgi:hypothetical protein
MALSPENLILKTKQNIIINLISIKKISLIKTTFIENHKISNSLFAGLAITALSPFITIGLSISFGNFIITSKI